MTLNEKIDNFYTSVIESATTQSVEIVDKYKHTLQKMLNERKKAALHKAENTIRVGSDAIRREKNRKLSGDTIEIKRKVIDKTEEIIEHIFEDVEIELIEYMKTSSYEDFLCKKIKEAYKFAQGSEIIIYINPSDKHRKITLDEKTGIEITISDRDFFGGIRAVIPSRSILIDYSFVTKLAEEKNSFKL